LSFRSRARSSEKTPAENMDDIELIECDSPSGDGKKVCTLWGVNLYEEDFGDTPGKSMPDLGSN